MEITFLAFLSDLASNPILLVTTILIALSIIVNGATDASNAIASAIATRSIKADHALAMAACGNFLGLVCMTFISTAIADTISGMVNFGGDSRVALIALAAAMISIIVWGVVAWKFGIPTSQSHSLIAGLTGAAIALQGGFGGINWGEWMKVIYGLVVSTAMGFGLGWGIGKLIMFLGRRSDRRALDPKFRWAQVGAAAGLSFMHGAQDGQKFLSIAMLGILLSMGGSQADLASTPFPLWLMVFCAFFMAFGTWVGGKPIIKSVGMNMVKLEKYQGFATSLAATISILFASLTGIPVSTTHTNTTAIMGVGAAKRFSAVKWSVAKNMVWTWVATFPGCGFIGFVLAKVMMMIL